VQTKVGKYSVEVRQAEFGSFVSFSSGERGRHERGDYLFWTAVLKRKIRFGRRKARKISGRAHYLLPPGDRFDRMRLELRTAKDKNARAAYKEMWLGILQEGRNIAYIRPSTAAEIMRWFKTHGSDVRYVTGMKT
jgi:hypothetical protein